jgi:cytochrome c biogenesis protein CcmG/thiol:disulfide interchange protein DsbE
VDRGRLDGSRHGACRGAHPTKDGFCPGSRGLVVCGSRTAVTQQLAERTSPRTARKASVLLAIGAVFLIGVLVIAFTRDTQDAQSPLLSRPAPEITSTTYDDGQFVLSRRKGSWVVLNFFNSTCVPCKREHPELVKFAEGQRAMGSRGAELYTIVNDDSEEAVRSFFAEFGGGWPIIRDDDARIAVDYGFAGHSTGDFAARCRGDVVR